MLCLSRTCASKLPLLCVPQRFWYVFFKATAILRASKLLLQYVRFEPTVRASKLVTYKWAVLYTRMGCCIWTVAVLLLLVSVLGVGLHDAANPLHRCMETLV